MHTSTVRSPEYLRDLALCFIRQHQRDSRTQTHLHNQLLDRCAAHVQAVGEVSRPSAELISAQALGEYECRRQRAYVDIDASTSHTVFLRDPASGRTMTFSAAGLLRIAQLFNRERQDPPATWQCLWVGVDPCAAENSH